MHLVSTVPTRYLQFFEDIEGASTYVWGAAALAVLYCSLEKACTFKRRQFSVSATLMQIEYAGNLEQNRVFQGIPWLLVRGQADKLDSETGETSMQIKPLTGCLAMTALCLIFNKILTMSCPQRSIRRRVVRAHEPHYIMRSRGYEDQLVSAVKASIVMLAKALTLRQKWYLEVFIRVNNAFEMLSKFVPVDMSDVEAKIEHLQGQYNDEVVPEEGGDDGVGQSSRVVDDLAPSTQHAVEEPRKYNT
ncbi:hypothetical protein AMTR_s00068p00052860 [Amborella trichopoda]|uniref:Aminotransferase-like plant mobile domain-containing protein n=1 Tax=Amborella trichopoda TaxID=13333 RepID=U5DFY7_AMBTC|nr:hypothetical protein AMTR_s00068p00052860 [Amborella trichopoda]